MDRNVFLNSLFAENYDDYYKTEPGKTIDLLEKEIMIPHLSRLTSEPMLELGCGTGHWTRFFCEQGFHVSAIDTSVAMLNQAKQKHIPNVRFELADAGNLPFPDVSFPVIASVTMLEFVGDIQKVLDEVYRVLKPGGTLVLGCLNELSELGKNKINDPVFGNARFFTVESLQQLLGRFGRAEFTSGVHVSPHYELLDGTPLQDTVHPAFIAASVKKTI